MGGKRMESAKLQKIHQMSFITAFKITIDRSDKKCIIYTTIAHSK